MAVAAGRHGAASRFRRSTYRGKVRPSQYLQKEQPEAVKPPCPDQLAAVTVNSKLESLGLKW